MDLDNAFLTEVEVKTKRFQDPKLAGVRKEYVRVMETVEAFGDKVNNMVDKQREDYMHAYEQHMYDVQRNLHTLREKVTEIANDKTRDEKIKQLSTDQIKYRHEALFYDEESALLRKKIKALKETLNSVERERDWLLRKLRDEKRRYNFLKDERLKYGGAIADSNSSMTSAASDSSFSIELLHERSAMHAVMASTAKKRSTAANTDWRSRLEHDLQAVNRDQAMVSTLPMLVNANVLAEQPQLNAAGKGIALSPTVRTKKEKRALAELVTLRARQEGIRDFITHCAACCGRGVWTKVSRRPLNDILLHGMGILNNPDAGDQERYELIRELAVIPETYYAISNLVMGKQTLTAEQQMLDKWGFGGGNDQGEMGYEDQGYDGEEAEEQRRKLQEELGGDDEEWTPLDLDGLDNIGDVDENEAAIAVLRLNDPLSKDRRTDIPNGSQSTSVLPPIKSSSVRANGSGNGLGKRSNSGFSAGGAPLLDADTLSYFREMQEQVQRTRTNNAQLAAISANDDEARQWLHDDKDW